jgi:hypothetical protein
MNNNISVCGADCGECSCLKDKICKGCNKSEGKVFHCPKGEECGIYYCCVIDRGYESCLDCPDIPCDIWKKTRDPKLSDEEFEASIEERISRLEEIFG